MNFSPDQFSYTVADVNDVVQWGAHSVTREGVEVVLTHLETGASKIFFMAGKRDHGPVKAHMDSLTDDLMLQWFVTRERKPKKDKK